MWKRIKLRFADLFIEFADRDLALSQIEEFAQRGTYPVYVIYGPEGCGKTALFRQAMEILKTYGYAVAMVSPLASTVEERFLLTENVKEIARELVSTVSAASAIELIYVAVELLYRAVRCGISRKIALLADDVFQAVGLDKAEQLVKMFLNMIEYPAVDYDEIVVLVSSSEGVTRPRVGRHNWARMYILWNMSMKGFEKLYEQLPEPKPSFEKVWKFTGGNPRLLSQLLVNDWNPEVIIQEIIRRGLLPLVKRWRNDLVKVVEDPDYLWHEYPRTEQLIHELVELNIITELWERDSGYVDTPPPDEDPEIGIGKYFAWQTPIHREAVRKALRLI